MGRILDDLQVENPPDSMRSLLEACLLVKRANLEALVTDPTPVEVLAMAKAGDFLRLESVRMLAAELAELASRVAIEATAAKQDAAIDAALDRVFARKVGADHGP